MYVVYKDELYHHGVKGQQWGVRRYQNPDGSYTSLGREHYGIGNRRYSDTESKSTPKKASQYVRDLNRLEKRMSKNKNKMAFARIRMQSANKQGDSDSVRKQSNLYNSQLRLHQDYRRQKSELISSAKALGYDINEQLTWRYARTGKTVARYCLFGPVGTIALGAYDYFKYGSVGFGAVWGNRYRVYDDAFNYKIPPGTKSLHAGVTGKSYTEVDKAIFDASEKDGDVRKVMRELKKKYDSEELKTVAKNVYARARTEVKDYQRAVDAGTQSYDKTKSNMLESRLLTAEWILNNALSNG